MLKIDRKTMLLYYRISRRFLPYRVVLDKYQLYVVFKPKNNEEGD